MKKYLFLFIFSFSICFGIEIPEFYEFLYVKNFRYLKRSVGQIYFKSIDKKYVDYLFDYVLSFNSSVYDEIEKFSKILDGPAYKILTDTFYIIKTKNGNIFLIEFDQNKKAKLIQKFLDAANAKTTLNGYYIATYKNTIVISSVKELAYNYKNLKKPVNTQLEIVFRNAPDIIYSKSSETLIGGGVDELLVEKEEKKKLFGKKEVPQLTLSFYLKDRKFSLLTSPVFGKVTPTIDKNMVRGFPASWLFMLHLSRNPYYFLKSLGIESVLRKYETNFMETFYDECAFGYRVNDGKADFLIAMRMKKDFDKIDNFMQNLLEGFILPVKEKRTWVIKKYKENRIFFNNYNEIVYFVDGSYVFLASNIKMITEMIETRKGKSRIIVDTEASKSFANYYKDNFGVFVFNFSSLSEDFFYSMRDNYHRVYSEDIENYSKWFSSLGTITGVGKFDKNLLRFDFSIR